MAAITEKVNRIARIIADIAAEPSERFGISVVLVEMYRYELNRTFAPLETPKTTASDAI